MANLKSPIGDQDLEQYLARVKEGDYVGLSWQWRNDRQRVKMNRLSKKGYFKRRSAKGTDTYTRTSKQYLPGDTVNKAISYSYQDPTSLPA